MKNLRTKFFMFLAVSSGIALLTGLSIWLLSPTFSSSYFSNSNSNSTAVFVSQAEPTPEFDPDIPKKLYSCLPKKDVQRMELRAKTTTNKTSQISYYLVGVHNQIQSLNSDEILKPNYQETVVLIDEIGCQVIVPKEKYGTATLTMYMPKTVAYELSLEYHRRAFAKAGGREKFQQLLWEEEQNSTPGDFPVYFPEEVWALKKLGVKLPPNNKINNNITELQSR